MPSRKTLTKEFVEEKLKGAAIRLSFVIYCIADFRKYYPKVLQVEGEEDFYLNFVKAAGPAARRERSNEIRKIIGNDMLLRQSYELRKDAGRSLNKYIKKTENGYGADRCLDDANRKVDYLNQSLDKIVERLNKE
jgi:hypothetical protein